MLFFFCVVIISCKEELPPEGPYEPFNFIQPDTLIVFALPGENIDLEIDLLTEDDILSLHAEYQVDDTGSFNPFIDLNFPEAENQETYTGVFGVPNTVTTGQYIRCHFYLTHMDTPVYTKVLRVNIQ